MTKEKLLSVTANDCDFEFYVGDGNGGQKKQKTSSACRCRHIASGAVAECKEHREQGRNKKEAFRKMIETPIFKTWLRIEILRKTGELALIEAEVEKDLRKAKLEVKDENGNWVDAKGRVLT